MRDADFFRAISLLTILLFAGCGPQPASTKSPPRQRTAEPVVRAKSQAEPPPPDVNQASEDEPESVPKTDPLEKFRPDDTRPQHDDARLAAAGIPLYESKRLKLYTDIAPDIAKTLPPLADRLYDALVAYFGPLPADRHGSEFQMTGYLMRDEAVFREQGLLKEVTTLHHGLHRQNRFWMREQNFEYYRRHLMLHECTHCFMTFVPGPIPPVWYMEGMAELFGTHRLLPDSDVEFRILPEEADDVEGWGRIAAIRKECAEKSSLTVAGVYLLPAEKFFKPEAYAWSWGLCYFLDSHPRYAKPFRKLGRHLHDGEFDRKFREAFSGEQRNLSTEWTLFEHQVQPGYDARRAAVDFLQGKSLAEGESRTSTILAARGWQDVGLNVEAGQTLELSAQGQFTLANDPSPWISEPQGISFRYFNGMPLGRLVACLDADPTADTPEIDGSHFLRIDPIGRSARLTIPVNGRLLLRLNDAWDSLEDNTGSVDVTIRRAATAP